MIDRKWELRKAKGGQILFTQSGEVTTKGGQIREVDGIIGSLFKDGKPLIDGYPLQTALQNRVHEVAHITESPTGEPITIIGQVRLNVEGVPTSVEIGRIRGLGKDGVDKSSPVKNLRSATAPARKLGIGELIGPHGRKDREVIKYNLGRILKGDR